MDTNQSFSPDRVRELCRQLEAGSYQCSMNCYKSIRRRDKIWSCSTCFHIFHMKCVQEWSSRSSDRPSFCCPQCRQAQPLPSRYVCFCGKVDNPTHDPGLTPHSCGRTCGKQRDYCPHPCPLQCHPGPCPPCSHRQGPVACPCGSSSYTYQCGTEDPRKTCDGICGKTLNCGKHQCTLPCHYGLCDICMVESEVSCDCGKEKSVFLCGTTFRCGQLCGKLRSCGHHHCTAICHKGACEVCPFDPEVCTTCFCGATPLTTPRQSCLDPIPSCGKQCKKQLPCGRHRCKHVCHEGECPPCVQMSEALCPCRKGKKMIPCMEVESFRCDRVCCTPLSCQRHKCMKKCCVDNGKRDAAVHICTAACDKKHPCGHPCILPCHKGRCPPCLATIPTFLYCRCGRTTSDPPPLPCGTKPPECLEPCTLSRSCGHPSADHTCHFGDCPPCPTPLERKCASHERLVTSSCGAAVAVCEEVCGRDLGCGHTCPRICHAEACGEGKECKLPCGRSREHCPHACKRPCHRTEPCPDCTQKVRLTCPCGKRVVHEKCSTARKKYGLETVTEESFVGRLECNDNCLFASRLEILSSMRKKVEDEGFVFVVNLYALGLQHKDYVLQIEERFRKFIQNNEIVAALPPAPSERRKLVHLLARYYRINTQSEDTGDKRSCIISKSPHTVMTKVRLSEHLAQNMYDPRVFIAKQKKNKQNQITTVHHSKLITAVLVNLLGYFTFEEPEAEEEYTIYFTSRGKREDACSILRQNHIDFLRPDELKK